MADRRRIATTSARIVTGVVGIGVAAATIFAVGRLPIPSVEAAVPSIEVTPTPAAQTRVCAGPLLALSPDGGLSAFADAQVATASESTPELEPAVSPENLTAGEAGSPMIARLNTDGASESPLLGAAQSQAADTDGIAGFTATECGAARAESWLVAGSSEVGRSSIISLTNPTDSDATVDLEFFGENGPVDAPGTSGIIVQAGQQRLFSLAGFAPNVLNPAVKVTARGGQVFASLQQSSVRGVTPAGVETAAAVSGPASVQHIAGVVVPSDAPEPVGGEGYDDNIPVVRIAVPGDSSQRADVQVSFTALDGGEAPLPLDATIYGGLVNEVSLAGLVGGVYGVTVTSSIPVVAAARTTSSAGGTDFAWFGASNALGDSAAVAVAPGPEPTLHVFNPGDSSAEVELQPEAGSSTAVSVGAGSVATMPLSAGQGYTLTGTSGLYAQVVYRGDMAFSATAVNPSSAQAGAVTVYPRG